MTIFNKFVIEWEGADKKITIASIRKDFTLFEHAAKMNDIKNWVLIDHKQFEDDTVFDLTNYDDWQSIDDAVILTGEK